TLTIASSGNGVSGSGTPNSLARFVGSAAIGNSAVYDNGGSVGIGTPNPATRLDVNGGVIVQGGTRLGSVTAPSIKVAKLTATTSSFDGGTAWVAHGLDDSKILSIEVMVDYSANAFVPPSYVMNPGYEFSWYSGGGYITVWNKSGNSSLILSRPFRILVTYE